MTKKILIAMLFGLLAVPAANAAVDEWKTTISNTAGLISAGTLAVYVQHPEGNYGRVGDSFHYTAFLTAPTGTNPTATWTTVHSHGCTIGTPTTRTASTGAGYTSSYDADITTTGSTCSLVLRVQFFAGLTQTLLYDQTLTTTLPSSDIQCSTALYDLDANGCRVDNNYPENQGVEIFQTVAVFVLLVLLVIWAESTKEFLIYILAVLVAGMAITQLWNDVTWLRMPLAACGLFLVLRTYQTWKEENDNSED